MSLPALAMTIAATLKLSERTGNVIENKGPLWKTREQTGNACESKGLSWSLSRPRFRTDNVPLPALARMIVETLKMKEQTGNVIENKGPLWKTREQTGNVCETKGLSRSLSRPCFRTGNIPLPGLARMTVETSKMSERTGNVTENKGLLWKTWRLTGNFPESKGLSWSLSRPCFRTDNVPLPARARMIVEILKMKERTGNVIENKGLPWKTWWRTGNVYENKGLIRSTRECCWKQR
jgi:hypothetical protein